MVLTTEQRQAFREALLSAFPERERLAQMLAFQLDVRLDEVALGDGLRQIVSNLILWAIREGRDLDLVYGAFTENPGNPALQDFVDELAPATAFLPHYTHDLFVSVAGDVEEEWLTTLLR